MKDLTTIIEANKSCKALNIMGELSHTQASAAFESKDFKMKQYAEEKAAEAAKYYLRSAKQGDIIAIHFSGVFCHLGFGVNKNLPVAIEWLNKSAEAGHCHSFFQLYLIYSGEEG